MLSPSGVRATEFQVPSRDAAAAEGAGATIFRVALHAPESLPPTEDHCPESLPSLSSASMR